MCLLTCQRLCRYPIILYRRYVHTHSARGFGSVKTQVHYRVGKGLGEVRIQMIRSFCLIGNNDLLHIIYIINYNTRTFSLTTHVACDIDARDYN